MGQIGGFPDDRSGLILSLIPPNYQNLGNPPSLDTCTRDTYAPETSFSVTAILRIAIGISSAAAHLHEQGIMHGDLYAHNILVNDSDHPLLGDFGAASSYDLDDRTAGAALERLEVRAFGCLLEDLLNRGELPDEEVNKLILDLLNTLKQACLQPSPADRPLFEEIGKTLAEVILID